MRTSGVYLLAITVVKYKTCNYVEWQLVCRSLMWRTPWYQTGYEIHQNRHTFLSVSLEPMTC